MKSAIFSTAVAVVLVSSANPRSALAQSTSDTSPALDLRHVGQQLELTVPTEPEEGVVLVLKGQEVDQLRSAPDLLLLTNAPVSESLRIPLTPEQRAFFYAIRKPGAVMEDFSFADIPDEEPGVPFALWTLGIPTNLVSGVSYTADFLLVASINALAAVTEVAQLLVVRASDAAPHPDAQITPPRINFVGGAARANIRVDAITSLQGYCVAVTLPDSGPATELFTSKAIKLAGSQTNPILIPGIIVPDSAWDSSIAFQTAQWSLPYVDSPSWSNPLPGDKPEITGTFGEWRGHKRDGVPSANYHSGLDLYATPGTPVAASRGGRIAKEGWLLGRYIVIDHLDGWYSRYLHMSPSAKTPAGATPAVGTFVQRGTMVGVVGEPDDTGVAAHLHFELREAGVVGLAVALPGKGIDPLRVPEIFEPRTPLVYSIPFEVGIVPENPALSLPHSWPGDWHFPSQLNDEAFVWVRVRHPEPTVADPFIKRRLAPRKVSFRPEGSTEYIELSTPNQDAIKRLLPVNTTPTSAGGFALYAHGSWPTPDPDDWFKYWFRLDTSGYRAESKGPRVFDFESEDYGGQPKSWSIRWGPQILPIRWNGSSVNGDQIYELRVRAWLGDDIAKGPENVSKSPWMTGGDFYRYELPERGRWLKSGSSVFEENPYLEQAQSKIRTNYFFWNPDSGDPNAKITVRSGVVPAIAHEAGMGCGPNLVYIAAGTLTLPTGRQVTVTQGFCMGKYEVTQAEYLAVMGVNPSSFTGDLNWPVDFVSHGSAVAYCTALTTRERSAGRLPSGRAYRLPTSTEWEYACRAGTTTTFHYGDALRSGMANFNGQMEYPPCGGQIGYCPNPFGIYLGRPTVVGSYTANAWGLHDMHGNVWEWCLDRDGRGWSPLRGGGLSSHAGYCRSDSELWITDRVASEAGFRVVLYP